MFLETELKLAIAPGQTNRLGRLALLRSATRGRPVTQHIYSVYYDTPEFALHDRGVALRLRRVGSRWVQTLKLPGKGEPGLHRREELEIPVPAQRLNHEALRESPAAELFADSAVLQKLAPVFVTDFKRTTRRLETIPGNQIEFCLDRGTISAGSVHCPISEIELELKTGSPVQLIDLALALVKQVCLRLQSASKDERGYALAAGSIAVPVKSRPPDITPQVTVTEAFRRTVLACMRHLQANEQGLLQSEDPEYMHQARVAVRRLRSAFSAFKRAFPSTLFARELEALRTVARALGEARDWDVFVLETLPRASAALPGEASLQELMDSAARLRADARKAAGEVVASNFYTTLLLELIGLFLRAPWGLSEHESAAERERPLTNFTDSVLQERHRKAIKRGRKLNDLDPGQLHQLRIQMKKLRYAVEFFSDLYEKKAVRDYLSAVAKLQGLLGVLNDITIAQRMGLTIRDTSNGPILEGVGLLRGWCSAFAQATRERLPKAWKQFESCEAFW
jgi:triphosphatase